MTETPNRKIAERETGGCEGVEEEDEVFFGSITKRERRQAVKYSRRRTVLYIPGFRKDKNLMRYSQEFTPDGPLIYAHEEITSDTSVDQTSDTVSPSKDKEKEPVVKKLFSPLASLDKVCKEVPEEKEEFSCGKEYSGSAMSLESDVRIDVKEHKNSTVTKSLDSCISLKSLNEGVLQKHVESVVSSSVKTVTTSSLETFSRLMSDSGVDCGFGDSIMSTRLSESVTSRTESVEHVQGPSPKSVLQDSVEHEAMADEVFTESGNKADQSSQISVQENADNLCRMLENRNHVQANYAGSFLSDMDQTGSVSDASDIDGFKRPFRLQGVFHGYHARQTNISTPRIPKAVPNLSFSSPHLLVSPIASYKSGNGVKLEQEDTDSNVSSKSSGSTPTKLVPSSISAFSRFPATTAIRRSLRKKEGEDLSIGGSYLPDPRQDDSVQAKKDCSVQTSDPEEFVPSASVNNLVSSSFVSPVLSSASGISSVPFATPTMTSTSTQSDFLVLPSTLAGQQLLMVKSCELSKGQLESSPESLVSQSSWADLKLSALGISKEKLGLATVSSDSSSFKTSGDTNFTSSSDANKPDLVTDSDKRIWTAVGEKEVLESLEKKSESESGSPSTEFMLGMNSEYFSLDDNDANEPDLCKSHRCDDVKGEGQSEDEGSDLDIDPAELDTMIPCQEDTVIEDDYSPVKGRGYERRMKQQWQERGLIWPSQCLSDSESSETEELCEESFDSGSSDSSLLDASDGFSPLGPQEPLAPASSIVLNNGKLQPWRPPGQVEVPVKKSSEVKGSKKGSSFKFKGSSSNKENQQGKKYPKSPLPKGDSKSDRDRKKSPCRKKKNMTEYEIEEMTKIHTMCNGQRVVRYLNFSESPMIIKHYPAPKEPSRLVWSNTIANSELTYHSPTRPPSQPKPKPILMQRPCNHTYPYSEDVPSPIILTRTRRTHTLSHKVTEL